MAGRRVNKKTKRKKKRIGTMDLILLLVFICLVIFTVTMIRLFQVYGSVPDTLVTCVFATLGGERGIPVSYTHDEWAVVLHRGTMVECKVTLTIEEYL